VPEAQQQQIGHIGIIKKDPDPIRPDCRQAEAEAATATAPLESAAKVVRGGWEG